MTALPELTHQPPRTGPDPAPPAGFRTSYPSYGRTAVLDELRASEYSYLDAGGHIYLDYTGAGLPAQAQLAEHVTRISGGCFGNPHSQNPTSALSTELVERARRSVLLSRARAVAALRRGVRTLDELLDRTGLPSGGAIRASVGLACTVTDVERFLTFLETTYRDHPADPTGLTPRLRC